MSYHGRFEPEKQPKKKRGLKIFLIILAVILVLVAGVVAAGAIYYNRMMNKMNIIELPEDTYVYTEETELTEAPTEAVNATEVEETTEPTTVVTEPPKATADDIINILVVGQSSRAGEESRMADTTMLVSVNTFDGTITVFSVLRDSYVKLPDYKGHVCGRAKFTVCYGLGYQWGDTAGAMEMTNICMRDNFGVEVDYNIEIDFESFVRVVDLLGGIEIELTEAEANYLNKEADHTYQTVTPGKNCLYGGAALAYARMRKAEGDADSDIVRTERQRKLVEAVFKELRRMSISELQELVNAVLPMITTSMTNAEITDMMVTMLPMISELTIQKGGTCPANTKGDMVDIYKDGMLHSILRFDEVETTKHMRAITEGEIIPEPATVQ